MMLTKGRVNNQSSLFDRISDFHAMHDDAVNKLHPFLENPSAFLATRELGDKLGNAHWQTWYRCIPIDPSRKLKDILKKKYLVTGTQNSYSFFKFIEEPPKMDSLSYPLKSYCDEMDFDEFYDSDKIYTDLGKEELLKLWYHQRNLNASELYKKSEKKYSNYKDLVERFRLAYPQMVFGRDDLIIKFLCDYYRVNEKFMKFEYFMAQRNTIYNVLFPVEWESYLNFKFNRVDKSFKDYLFSELN